MRVVNKICSFKNIFAVSGTTNIKELALTAPIFEEAKKYIVLAKDITKIENIKYLSKITEQCVCPLFIAPYPRAFWVGLGKLG
ncbi:MAG: hypothetical protein CMG41_01870 [Candidatus Marinimicrobia bacterium]|nr:hypothetical protein [Candidatus Neomarinimicrobiota bacterium]